jgi:Flp pilus assembly protein TadG
MPIPVTGGRNARQRARSDHRIAELRTSERGQATVELALVLPIVLALLVLVFQVALVARDEILVVHVARDATREATVTRDPGRIATAATRNLPGATVRVVRRGGVGAPVEVEVSYVSRTDLPLIGALLPDITLHGGSVMRVERP